MYPLLVGVAGSFVLGAPIGIRGGYQMGPSLYIAVVVTVVTLMTDRLLTLSFER